MVPAHFPQVRFRRRNSFCAVTAILCVTALPTGTLAADDDRPLPATRAALIRFEGMIDPIHEQYFYRKLDKARTAGVDLVIVEIDSPGGYVDSSLKLAEHLRDLPWATTVAYVPREALSGAAIMALGADEIVLAPEARLGDAGPIFQGEDALFRHAPEKIRSHLVRQVRDLAERQGRPPALAEAMVDMDLIVYRVTNRDGGQVTFMSDPEIESSENPDQWEKGPPVQESRKGLFLEVNGTRAVELGLAEATAASREQLAARYGVPPDKLLTLETDWVDTTVMILNSGLITALLLIVGLIALYIEFSAPGISIGGLVSGLCFTLFFWSRFLGGTSGWLEVILFLLGLVFVLVELFVLPGFGIAGVTGLLLILVSIIMASQGFVIPHTDLEMRTTLRSVMILAGSGCASIAAMVVLSRFFGTIPVLNRLALPPPASALETPATSERGTSSGTLGGVQVGDQGMSDSPLRPAGRVCFHGNYADVVADSFVESGRPVQVIKISGNRIMVREVAAQDAGTHT